MKKLILALAAVALLGTAAQAQKINKEALLQKIEKNGRSAEYRPLVAKEDYLARQGRKFYDKLCGGSGEDGRRDLRDQPGGRQPDRRVLVRGERLDGLQEAEVFLRAQARCLPREQILRQPGLFQDLLHAEAHSGEIVPVSSADQKICHAKPFFWPLSYLKTVRAASALPHQLNVRRTQSNTRSPKSRWVQTIGFAPNPTR